MFGPLDGWHTIPQDPQQHFIFNGYAICKKYESLPNGSHHDNDPLKHCTTCQNNLNALQAIGEQSRKMKIRDVFNLLDNVGKQLKSRAFGEPENNKEKVVVVLTSHNKKGEVAKKRFIS